MENIQKIYKMLELSSTDETRREGMNLMRTVKELALLIQPEASPIVWECCAQVLCEKSDVILQPHLIRLLEWLQDLNWPGALFILNRLKNFSGEKLKESFLSCFYRASSIDSQDGLMWLDYLSELLDNEELKDVLPSDVTQTLKHHYQNWGFWRSD